VTFAPVENTPSVLSDLDPLQARPAARAGDAGTALAASGVTPPTNDALTRMYRPQALDVPVLVARDAPITTLDPSTVGAFADRTSAEDLSAGIETALNEAVQFGPQMPQVVA